MQKIKAKTMAIMIVAILTISIGATMILPDANAHTPAWQIPTYAYCNVAPNPAGLGQTVTIGMWIQIPPPTAAGTVGDRWHDFNVTITKPDGTKETLGPFTSDATGGTCTLYTPNTIRQLLASCSTIQVKQCLAQTEPHRLTHTSATTLCPPQAKQHTAQYSRIQFQLLPTNPLPTSYWTRPIQAGNVLWSTISGNWLGFGIHSFANTGRYNNTGNYNPYSDSTTGTPHYVDKTSSVRRINGRRIRRRRHKQLLLNFTVRAKMGTNHHERRNVLHQLPRKHKQSNRLDSTKPEEREKQSGQTMPRTSAAVTQLKLL